MDNKTLSELVCTRMSHDVIGNVGAVANAAELLEENDMDFFGDIQSILKTSSFAMSARLKFFRTAFGLSNTSSDIGSIEKILRDYLKTIGNINSPINLNFGLKDEGKYKIAMLGAMILADLMIRGGNIDIIEEGNKLLITTFENDRIADEKAARIKDIISGKSVDLEAQHAPVYYLSDLLSNLKYNLAIINQPLGIIIESN